MYILDLNQAGRSTEIGLFSKIEEGREFISQLDAYEYKEEDGFIYEFLNPEKLPDYLEIKVNGNVVPFTRFMFLGDERIDVFWKEINNLSEKGKGIIDSATRVDAYAIDNRDLKEYIEERERKYDEVRSYLAGKNYEVTRSFFGSEDGEAILYREKDTDDWHFLTHMDPFFCDLDDLEEFLQEFDL